MANNKAALKNVASFAIGYSLSKYKEKRKIKKSTLAEHIERYVKENDCDNNQVSNILYELAEEYAARAAEQLK